MSRSIGSSAGNWLGGVVLVLLAAGAVTARTAAMRLPHELSAAADRQQATGFGGANRGRYTLGRYGGEFVRIESRLALFDPLFVG